MKLKQLKLLRVWGWVGLWLGGIGFMILPARVWAITPPPIGNPALGGALQTLLGQQSPGVSYFGLMIPMLITLGLVVASIVFFFMLLIGGIQWITAAEDKTNLEKARGRITSALVGIVIVFSIFAILSVVETLFGFTLTAFCIPTVEKPNCTVTPASIPTPRPTPAG